MNNLYYNKIKKHFDTEGFVKISNFFEKKLIKSIKKNLLIYLEKKRKFLNKREIHYADDTKLINSVHNLDWPYIKRFRKNKKILKIIRILLKDNLKDFGAELFAKPAKVGKAVPIHQDNFYWNVDNSKGVTVWIALDKVTKRNGAIFYFNKSHKKGLLKHRPSFVPGSSQELKNKKILKKMKKSTPELNIGDILIHDCLVIHGSKKNITKFSRTGLTLRYIGKSSKINKKQKAKYEKALKKQLA